MQRFQVSEGVKAHLVCLSLWHYCCLCSERGKQNDCCRAFQPVIICSHYYVPNILGERGNPLRDKTRIELFFARDRAKPGVEPIKWDIKRKHTYQKLGSKTKEIHCQEYGTIFVFIMSSWKNWTLKWIDRLTLIFHSPRSEKKNVLVPQNTLWGEKEEKMLIGKRSYNRPGFSLLFGLSPFLLVVLYWSMEWVLPTMPFFANHPLSTIMSEVWVSPLDSNSELTFWNS